MTSRFRIREIERMWLNVDEVLQECHDCDPFFIERKDTILVQWYFGSSL